MDMPLRVLVIEDSEADAEIVLQELRRGGFDPRHDRVETAAAMRAALLGKPWDVVLADCSLPQFSAHEALHLLQQSGLDLPFIIVSGFIGEDAAVCLMKAGAHDYLRKDSLKRLVPSIQRELQKSRLRAEHQQAHEELGRSEERFRQMTEHIGEVFWMATPDRRQVLYLSPAYEKIWGRSRQDVYDHPFVWIKAIHPDDRERIGKACGSPEVSGDYDEEFRIIRPDGSYRWIRNRAFPIRDASGQVYRITGIAEDITERRWATEALAESEERLRMAIGAAQMYTWDWDIPNDQLLRIGHQRAHGSRFLVSRGTYSSFLESIHSQDRARFDEAVACSMRTLALHRIEFRVVQAGNEVHWLEAQGQAYADSNGAAVRMVGVTQDITERKRAEELITHLAFYDNTTQLPNRNSLYEAVKKAIQVAESDGGTIALLLLDLNHFREINNTLGHARGDVVLQEVGRRLQSALVTPQLVARLGADKFGILAPGISGATELDALLERIHETLRSPVIIERLPIAIEACTGVALYPDHGTDPDTLIQRADIAMYEAKKTGTGHVVYEPASNRYTPVRLARMAELRMAILHDELKLHYQPIIGLRGATVCGVEALVRWPHPEHGMIPPDEFIGAAERTGVIHLLAEWVLQAAMKQCAVWRQMGFTLPVSVNLSARNLLDPKLPERIRDSIRHYRIPAESLAIEITESAIMTDTARAADILHELHETGLRLAIDDFGVGYSSLSYLRRLPVDCLKVDRSFVTNMLENPGDAMIVRSTIELAHNLGLHVVAEGVESEAQYQRLLDLGCDAVQGYFMSRPLPADEICQWLSTSRWGVAPGNLETPRHAALP